MKKLFLSLPIFASLTACVAPIDSKAVPIIIQTPAPTVIIDTRSSNSAMHVCRLTAFTDTFVSENANRGLAKLNVQKQCLSKRDEMFCREKDIQCTEYK